MSWEIGYRCDGHLNGRKCRTGATRFVDLTEAGMREVSAQSLRDGFRPLSTVLSPETHLQVPGELLCKRTDHDEEQPGYGPEDWVRIAPAQLKPGDVWPEP
jgi:hypothetical protein